MDFFAAAESMMRGHLFSLAPCGKNGKRVRERGEFPQSGIRIHFSPNPFFGVA
jgi:hypothetical protein